MATRRSSGEPASAGFVSVLLRAVLIVVFTGVETLALVAWLGIVEDAPPVSEMAAVGLGVLLAGLFLEHYITDLAVNGSPTSFRAGAALVFSATETALWAIWLVVANRIGGLQGLLIAGALLAVLLVPQHTIEDNALRGRGLVSNLLDFRTLGFSLVEAMGATVWLLLVTRGGVIEPVLREAGMTGVAPATLGVAVLAVALLIEHGIGVSFSRRV